MSHKLQTGGMARVNTCLQRTLQKTRTFQPRKSYKQSRYDPVQETSTTKNGKLMEFCFLEERKQKKKVGWKMVQFYMYSWPGQVFNWPRLPMQKSLPSFLSTINYDSNFWNNRARCVCVLFSRNQSLEEINLLHTFSHLANKEAFKSRAEISVDYSVILQCSINYRRHAASYKVEFSL